MTATALDGRRTMMEGIMGRPAIGTDRQTVQVAL
jgi:hypothetical protein